MIIMHMHEKKVRTMFLAIRRTNSGFYHDVLNQRIDFKFDDFCIVLYCFENKTLAVCQNKVLIYHNDVFSACWKII